MEWYHILLIVIGAIVLLSLVALILHRAAIKPSTRKCSLEKYTATKFAHRGLHGGGIAENSLSAFEAAMHAGFGIELDVRLTRDGELVVFHDANLKRMCGIDALVSDYTAEELSKMSLAGTDDGIPTFKSVLNLVDGAVPLLVEIKMEGDEHGVPEALAEVICESTGDYIVESFNPLALRTFRKIMPEVPRGILSSLFTTLEQYRGKILYFILENLLLNFLAKPDFIAYEKKGHTSKNLIRIRRRWSTPLFAWTVTSAEEEAKCVNAGFDTIIFEGYLPDKK